MSKKANAKKKKAINIFSRIIGILFSILLGVFIALIVYMDVLPTKYFSLVIGGLVVVGLILCLMLFIPKIKTKIKVFANIFAILFGAVFVFGIGKLYNTVDFLNKITDTKYQLENYYVVVLDNQTYDKITDLKNDNMGFFVNDTKTYKEAKAQLTEKVKTKNTDYEDQYELANDLLDEKVDAMFINEAYKSNLDEEIEEFGRKTKVLDTITIKSKNKTKAKKVEVTKQSFNLYVSGIDTYGKIGSVSRSDVNMIITVNPTTHQMLLTSIPRDYYVQLHGTTGLKDKLTHAGIYGVDKSITTLEDLFGIEINYYFRVNFSTLIKVVDTIGGIDIYSDKAFIPYTDHSVSIKYGNQHLNGKQALAFSRERYAYREGDRHRVQNQQTVITAIMNKMLSSKTLISKYDSLLKTFEGSFQTNMNTGELTSLIKKQIDKMPNWSIISQSVNGTDSSNYTYSAPSQKAYVMEPDMSTVKAASEKIKEVYNAKRAVSEGPAKTTTANAKN